MEIIIRCFSVLCKQYTKEDKIIESSKLDLFYLEESMLKNPHLEKEIKKMLDY